MRFFKIVFTVYFTVSFGYVKAQDQYGLSQSNYSPTSTVFHNPSSIVDSKVHYDIHLLGGDFFVHNNYMYIPGNKFNIFDILSTQKLPIVSYDNAKDSYNMYASLDLQFLCATFQNKEHGFGLTTRLRSMVDVRNIPRALTSIIKVEGVEGPTQTPDLSMVGRDMKIDGLTIATMVFDEIGLSYANATYHRDRNLMILGASLKYLAGFYGGGFKVENMNYKIDSTGTINYSNFNVSNNSTTFASKFDLEKLFVGTGLSVDFGITYKKMLYNVTNYDPFSKVGGRKPYDYKWKVAASLIDFGWVGFNKAASSVTVHDGTGSMNAEQAKTMVYNTARFIRDEIPAYSSIDSASSFSMGLPTALVMQYDYNTEKNFHFSTQYTFGFSKKNQFGIQRPHVFTFAPRYETRWLEIALPISVFNYQEVRSGLMLRVGGISFGTDKLGTFLGLSNVTGYDFYFNTSFKIHTKKHGKSSVRRRARKY